MDIFLLHAIVKELSPLLLGRRPGKVWQIGQTDLMVEMNLRQGRTTRWLRISTDPLRLGLYVTARGPRSYSLPPRADTPFVELWQKHLDGMRLTEIEPLGYDRIVKFHFVSDATEEIPEQRRTLVVALTGRGANLWLLAGDRILAELRERDEAAEEYHDPLPPGDRIDTLACTAEQLAQVISDGKGEIAEVSQKRLLGFTPLLARELAARIAESGSVAIAWNRMVADLTAETALPTIYADPPLTVLTAEPGRDEMTLLFSSIPLHHLAMGPADSQTHPSTLNDAAEIYYGLLEERRQFITFRQRLASLFSTRLKRLSSLLANLEREERKYGEVEVWQRYGDLLLTNHHEAVSTGNGTFLVVDYFDADQNLIEIDAAECGTVTEAAEHYFRMARKGRHSRDSIAARRPPVLIEIAGLKADQEQLSSLSRLSELLLLAEKYGLTGEDSQVRGGSPTPSARARNSATAGKGNRTGSVADRIPGARRYRSSDGYEILVGRADRDNDNLTLRVARSFDLWFHAADYPGSHVILRNPKRQPVPPRSIAEAAQLAAKFSQAKDLPKAAVNYCEKKFVTKPKGFAPGQVRLASFRTILVEPAEAGERI